MIPNIESNEFEILKNELLVEKLDLSISFKAENEKNEHVEYFIENLLDKCYKLDTNSTPNCYCLQKWAFFESRIISLKRYCK